MKKIILFTVIIIFIPFVIVSFFKIDKKEEINLNYESNTIIRVKRLSSGEIEYLPFEEYIVGVLAGEMPIYFEKDGTVLNLVYIVFTVLAVIGIINALNGRAKELPIIGKYRLLK